MDTDNHEGDAEVSHDNGSSTDAGTHEQESARTSTDTLHDLLSNERRRRLLSYLIEQADETVLVDDIVDSITRHERPNPGPVPHRNRVAIDLHHVHLPKLADAGVIEHDSVAETIRYDGPETLGTLLAATEEFETQEE